MPKKSNSTFKRINRIAEHCIDQIGGDNAMYDRKRLDRLMRQMLPKQWQSRAISAGIHEGVWILQVNSGSDAYQLRFMATEIEAKLAEALPHPPKLKIQVNPAMWQQQKHTTRPPATLYQQRYSDSEAEAILQAFKRNSFK